MGVSGGVCWGWDSALQPLPVPSDASTPSAVARVGLMHIGVFILLLLSGERNFGVRLNKPYSGRVPMDIPVFTGTHADLLIVVRAPLAPGSGGVGGPQGPRGCHAAFHTQVFHKIITSGHQRLQPLFDCLLTIVVNGKGPLVPAFPARATRGRQATGRLSWGSGERHPLEAAGNQKNEQWMVQHRITNASKRHQNVTSYSTFP